MSLLLGFFIGVALAGVLPWIIFWAFKPRPKQQPTSPLEHKGGYQPQGNAPRPTQAPPKPADAAQARPSWRPTAPRPAPPKNCAWNTLQETCMVCGHPEYCPAFGFRRAA